MPTNPSVRVLDACVAGATLLLFFTATLPWGAVIIGWTWRAFRWACAC